MSHLLYESVWGSWGQTESLFVARKTSGDTPTLTPSAFIGWSWTKIVCARENLKSREFCYIQVGLERLKAEMCMDSWNLSPMSFGHFWSLWSTTTFELPFSFLGWHILQHIAQSCVNGWTRTVPPCVDHQWFHCFVYIPHQMQYIIHLICMCSKCGWI